MVGDKYEQYLVPHKLRREGPENNSPFDDGMNGAGCKSFGVSVDMLGQVLPDKVPATQRQEGAQRHSSLYRDFAIQPVEFCQKNRLGWCESNVVKYVCRWRNKNGLEDLKKAKHYIDLLIELEQLEG
jgi:hypothetical protein